jgi:phosphoribosylformimino-5-aminoimidazole carboxamide ribotide isomerase
MIILPAVDIKGGKCVRLVEGREGTETTFGDDPAACAARWVREGAQYLHVVDLDGAFQGAPRNLAKVAEIARTGGVPVEFGGGVRETPVIEALLAAGVTRVIIGSAIIDNRHWAEAVLTAYGGRIAVGIDASGGKVAIHGWKTITDTGALDLARECESLGAAAVIYTDISRDGKMEGANLDAMRAMVEAVRMPVIASGGVTTLADVRNLAAAGCYGAIIGRSLYERRISLPEAIKAGAARAAEGA